MLLTLLMNLNAFGPPPTPDTGQSGDGFLPHEGGRYNEDEKREKDRRKKILDEDEFIVEFLKRATNIINNQ